VVAIAAGGFHSLVLKSDGTLQAWGDDDNGQIDIPPGLSNVVAIAAGAAHNLVLKADGTLIAWGMNTYGQTNIPAGLSNIIAIAAGGYHNLVLRNNGTVVAWGAGVGSNTNVDYGQNLVPANLTNVVQIAGGLLHSLALSSTNSFPAIVPLTGPTAGTNGFTVFLPTRNGRVYRLEYKTNLTDSTWVGLPLVAGNGGQVQLRDPDISPSQKFYRVEQW
jgi:hypothetical protein